MTTNYYKVLQAVLSQTCDVICGQENLSRPEAFAKAEAFIRENSERWRLADPGIQYADPFCRMAYLYMNVAIHASLVERAISSFVPITRLIEQKIVAGEELHVCALGGGPGSELLGLVSHVEKRGFSEGLVNLDFVLVDRVREWDESWHALKQGVDEQLKAQYGSNRTRWPIVISRSFLPLDVTHINDFENFATRFSGTHIFLCCYLISELKAYSSEFEKVLQLLVTRANASSLWLFVDRDEKVVRETVLNLIAKNGLLTLMGTTQERGRIEYDPADLGEWYINIPSLPRQKWLAFFALAQSSQ